MNVVRIAFAVRDREKQAAKAASATGWLVKPFDPAQLLATIRKVLD